MFGETLFPLNKLEAINPTVHASAIRKYDYRKTLLDVRDSILSNLWNDYIFTLAVNPRLISDEYDKARLRNPIKGKRFFKIDSKALDQEKLLIYWMNGESVDDISNWKKFKELSFWEKRSLLKPTRGFVRCINGEGSRIIYPYTPHVMYHGNIDITNSELIEI
jgi:hypothetical protein